MSRGYEPEEFIDPRQVPEERGRKIQQPSRDDESRDQVREEHAQGAGPIPIPAWLARLSCARSTKSGAGPIVCGHRKSQRWSKPACFVRLLRRT